MNTKIILFIIGLLFVFLGRSLAQKNDTLIMVNSDKITGEIKKLQYGALTIKTDDMGTLSVDWRRVKSLQSKKTFEIVMSSGMQYYAGFDTTSQEGKIRLVLQMMPNNVSNDVDLLNIVQIARIKGLFWSRFDGKFGLGYGVQKANSLKKFNFSGNITYRDRKNQTELSLRSDRSNSEGTNPSVNQTADLSYYRILSGRWFVGATASAEENTELGLDLRLVMSADAGDQLVQTNKMNLLILGGVQATREWSADDLQVNNLEGKLFLQHKLFSYRAPKISVTTNFTLYPGLTDWGRIRTDFNFNASIEVFKDFFISAGIYHKFDNRPATEGASKTDWGLDTSIGYSF